jgi:hypothetical protein
MICFQPDKGIVLYEISSAQITETTISFVAFEDKYRCPHKGTSSDGRTYRGKYGYQLPDGRPYPSPSYQVDDPKCMCKFRLETINSRADFLSRLQEEGAKAKKHKNRLGPLLKFTEDAPEGSIYLFGNYYDQHPDCGDGPMAVVLIPDGA